MQGANFACIYSKSKAMGYRNIIPEHTWKSYTMFLLDTLPVRLRNNYVKKFNTSIKFWHTTGGGLDENVIQELEEHTISAGMVFLTIPEVRNHGWYLWGKFR